MKKCLIIVLCLTMMVTIPVQADVLSDLETAESSFGMDNSDKPAVERIGYLEEQLGIDKNEGTFAERLDAIKHELGITDEAENTVAEEKEALSSSETALVIAPSDDFVIERLKLIETIIDVAPVTEDHDPNGLLGKQGGYIGCIYFADNQVDRSQIYIENDNVIDIGTEGGGAIEIYKTADEASARDQYLASFDGTSFASGSHRVVGTCIVRTSNHLTGTQQNDLTDEIVRVLTTEDVSNLQPDTSKAEQSE